MYFHVVSYFLNIFDTFLHCHYLFNQIVFLFFGWDSPIEHGLKTAPLWKDVILQVTTPCYLHVTVQQKRGKRCLGAQIVNDFWMGKVGTCIPANSKHLDFLRFHSIFFDVIIWISVMIWTEFMDIITSTLVASRLCMVRMRSLNVTPDQTRCELRSDGKKPSFCRLTYDLMCRNCSEVIAPWWVQCRVLENGKSCRKLKVWSQKIFLAKGFNAQRNMKYESMFPSFCCFPLQSSLVSSMWGFVCFQRCIKWKSRLQPNLSMGGHKCIAELQKFPSIPKVPFN